MHGLSQAPEDTATACCMLLWYQKLLRVLTLRKSIRRSSLLMSVCLFLIMRAMEHKLAELNVR